MIAIGISLEMSVRVAQVQSIDYDADDLRQTDPKTNQYPELHTRLHLQAPDEPHRICGDCTVDEHAESLDRNPSAQLRISLVSKQNPAS
jgi:hypothetical protein